MSSWLSKMLGTNSINQDFNYDPKMVSFSPPPISSLGLAAQRNTAGQMASNASNMQGMASQMMNMNSGYYSQMQNNLQEQVGDATTSATAQANRQLSMTGGSGGSLRNLLGTTNASRVGEQVRQGVIGMYGQGMQNAGNFMGQANQALQGAGQIQGQASATAGQFISAMESNRLQAGMANQAAYNEQQQYTRTSNYNQAAANKASRGEFAGNIISAGASVKAAMLCLPEGTKIDTSKGKVKVEDIKAGDKVIGYDGKETEVLQKHEYKENPKVKRFLEIKFEDNSTVDLCDMHRIKNVRSKDYKVGDVIETKTIKEIKWYDGVNRSYDLLTKDKGYRISNVPVNTMIGELDELANKLRKVA